MAQFQYAAFADEASEKITEQIVAMKRNGISMLEARNIDGENVSKISIAKAKEVRTRLEAEGLSVWSAGSPMGKIKITDDFAPHLDEFCRTIEIAQALGAKCMRMFSFYGSDWTQEKRDEVMLRLSRFMEKAQGSGIAICHENEKGIYGDIATRCLDIHKSIPDLKLIFDPANFVQSGQDTLEAWDLLGKAIYYFHVKDALADGNVVPVGYGIGNVEALLRSFAANGGKVLTLEPHLTVFKGLANLEQEGERSEVGKVFAYPSADAAFDAASQALHALTAKI